jgi:hypothetical protein
MEGLYKTFTELVYFLKKIFCVSLLSVSDLNCDGDDLLTSKNYFLQISLWLPHRSQPLTMFEKKYAGDSLRAADATNNTAVNKSCQVTWRIL